MGYSEIPKRYSEFIDKLGIELTPGQLALARVLYDGDEPEDVGELALALFGGVRRLSVALRRTAVAVIGARAGKTYLLVALRMLHLALTVDISTLAPGEIGYAIIVTPHLNMSAQALRYVTGALDATPWLAAHEVERSEGESVTLARGRQRVIVEARAASARGLSGRGFSLVGAALDECAFFRDENYKVNDDELYKAFIPRILPGGQMVIASTPWAEYGLLYSLWKSNFGHPETCSVAHAPTLVVRDVPFTRELVEMETKRDSQNAKREYGAEFYGNNSTHFFEKECIDACFDGSLPTEIERYDGVIGSAGADFGFTRNSSTLCVCQLLWRRITVSRLIERKPAQGAPLKPSEVVAEFAKIIAEYGIDSVMADQHYRESVVEGLENVDIEFSDAPLIPAEVFVSVRALMREGLVAFGNHPKLIEQLRGVMWRPTSGGRITIVLPNSPSGEHADLVSAFVLAVYQRRNEIREQAAAIKPSRELVDNVDDGPKRHWLLKR